MINIQFELDEQTALALAQFCKRVGWSEIRQCAVDNEEASQIVTGIIALTTALAEQGFNPR